MNKLTRLLRETAVSVICFWVDKTTEWVGVIDAGDDTLPLARADVVIE